MSRGARVRPDVTDDNALAQARQRFLTAEPVEADQVRGTILASWWRSRRSNVAADRIAGHEHYAENLETLACAGVPIRHPISGKTIGAVDLTCWRKDADALLIALARTAADQITQAVLASTGAPEYELLEEYLRACRRTAGIVLALNSDTVMMNDYARHVLDPATRSRCWAAPATRWPPTISARSMSSCPAAPGRGCIAGPYAGAPSGAAAESSMCG